ncbi:MAG: TetR family transcriptional regulator, partial [Aliifodinibius sp.]|nr:TetR family transcriptional regulator [Fodinibius sp.]
KEEAAITRDQLLNKALTVFSKKGYSAATLQDIASEADMTRGAIYWHFGSKAELYNTLIKEYSDRGSQIVKQA